MQKLIWSLLLIVLIGSSCQDSTGASDAENKPAVFFALEEFIAAEAERLQAANVQLDKRIRYNGQEEIQTRKDINYEQELSMFSRADINKKAWTDLYQADTIFQGPQAREVSYRALDPELEVRSLQVKWTTDGAVSEINILRKSESTLASNIYDLHYSPQEGYLMKTQQQNSSADLITIMVVGKFLSEN